jgi:transcriptional regulator GlxA family with amidase domain
VSGQHIGLVGFDGVMALDIVGPLDAFNTATEIAAGSPKYQCSVLGAGGSPFKTESGLLITPHAALETAPLLDTLIIAGGRGLREAATNAFVARWVKRRAPGIRRIASVCTGIYGLAPTGLLDGRRVTTHWRFAADVAARYPALRVEPDAIFVADGPFVTSAGVTAGIDLALALIEADHGAGLAMSVARELVVYLKRDGGQAQFSEPLRFQSGARDRIGELVGWITAHLTADLSVEALADRACLSPRHLTRRFRSAYSLSPAELVEVLRLDEARLRLASGHVSIDAVARSVGFRSPDVFRRAFERRFSVAPRLYRARFGPPRRSEPVRSIAPRATARSLRPARRRAARESR